MAKPAVTAKSKKNKDNFFINPQKGSAELDADRKSCVDISYFSPKNALQTVTKVCLASLE
jgi:hypothetical protein